MRCLACNRMLNDRESVRKYASTGTFVDLCNRCFSFVAEDIPDVDDGVDTVEGPYIDVPEEDEGADYQQFGWDGKDNNDYNERD